MSKKKAYNEGVEAGLKIANGVITQEAEAMKYLKKKLDNVVDRQEKVTAAVNEILQCQNSVAVEKYYGICNVLSPMDLQKEEKYVLLDLLATLTFQCKNFDDRQRKYLANLKHYIQIPDYTPNNEYNFEYIDNIRDLDSQEIMVKCIREFLFLENLDFSFAEDYENLFNYFSVKNKKLDQIDNIIDITYYMFGEDGIIEMYGSHVLMGEFSENAKEDIGDIKVGQKFTSYDGRDISKACADAVNTIPYIELDQYLITKPILWEKYEKVNKMTGEKSELRWSVIDNNKRGGGFCGFGNCLFQLVTEETNYISKYNVENDEEEKIEYLGEISQNRYVDSKLYVDGNYIIYWGNKGNDKHLFCYDCVKRKTAIIAEEVQSYCIHGMFLHKGKLYINQNDIYEYDLATDKLKMLDNFDVDKSVFLMDERTFAYKNILYTLQPVYGNEIYFLDLNNPLSVQTKVIPTYGEKHMITAYGKVYYITVNSEMKFGCYDVVTGIHKIIKEHLPAISSYTKGILRKKTVYVHPLNMQIVGKWLYFRDPEMSLDRKIRCICLEENNG